MCEGAWHVLPGTLREEDVYRSDNQDTASLFSLAALPAQILLRVTHVFPWEAIPQGM